DVYFGPTRTLFPLWPQYHWPEIHGLLGLTLALLLGPKLLALTLRNVPTRSARRFGGRLSDKLPAGDRLLDPARAGDDAVPHHLPGRHPGRQRGGLAAAGARRSRHGLAPGPAASRRPCAVRGDRAHRAGRDRSRIRAVDLAGGDRAVAVGAACRAQQPPRHGACGTAAQAVPDTGGTRPGDAGDRPLAPRFAFADPGEAALDLGESRLDVRLELAIGEDVGPVVLDAFAHQFADVERVDAALDSFRQLPDPFPARVVGRPLCDRPGEALRQIARRRGAVGAGVAGIQNRHADVAQPEPVAQPLGERQH